MSGRAFTCIINKSFFSPQNDVLPLGEKSISGSSYTIKQTTRHDSGVYICTANNGVGTPATEQINLKVNCKYLFIFSYLFFLMYNLDVHGKTRFERELLRVVSEITENPFCLSFN